MSIDFGLISTIFWRSYGLFLKKIDSLSDVLFLPFRTRLSDQSQELFPRPGLPIRQYKDLLIGNSLMFLDILLLQDPPNGKDQNGRFGTYRIRRVQLMYK